MEAPRPVIAAVIFNEKNQVLLCQRKKGALAGKWEFPGGKLEAGESPEDCLVREIREELQITIQVDQILKAVNVQYEHGNFFLVGYLATYQHGSIQLEVHQAYAWVDLWRVSQYDLARANVPIAQMLEEKTHTSGTHMRSYGSAH